jgi:hypothetical protein
MSESKYSFQPQTRGEINGTKPVTDRKSKQVMLRAERGDKIRVQELIAQSKGELEIPEKFEVQQRVSTYYGRELLIEPTASEEHCKFMLTAPGPDTFLYLWSSETDSEGFREGWSTIAELKADFTEGIPQYSICQNCGNPIKSLEHEKLALVDNCPNN